MDSRSSSPERCYVCTCDIEAHEEKVAPCRCTGTAKYVHQQCIQSMYKSGYEKCSMCKCSYEVETDVFSEFNIMNHLVFARFIQLSWTWNFSCVLAMALQLHIRNFDYVTCFAISSFAIMISNNTRNIQNLFYLGGSIAINTVLLDDILNGVFKIDMSFPITFITMIAVITRLRVFPASLSEYLMLLRLYAVFQLVIFYIYVEQQSEHIIVFFCLCCLLATVANHVNSFTVDYHRHWIMVYSVLMATGARALANRAVGLIETTYLMINIAFYLIDWVCKRLSKYRIKGRS